ncbi:MAG TPA: Uma2 family endonuclease [Tepidisphaeraceae bacterium]|nr:Uma2 family endonuclease [Tepidisphaeraceae bacterium]
MTILDPPIPRTSLRTVEDLLDDLGVPASRVLLNPAPGQATIQDVIDIHARTRRLCELVDGTLIEKPVGFKESMIALAIASAIRAFVLPRNLGVVSGPDGMMNLFADLVRMPDVAFTAWARFPGGKVPEKPVPRLAPDLAVEVLSPSNTRREMERKRGEYFQAGARLVWIVDLDARTVDVYTLGAPDAPLTRRSNETLDGGEVLPGFSLPLTELFAELDRTAGA